MAFDSTSAASDRHVLIEFALSGTTYRVADKEMVLSDGTYYAGKILYVSPLKRTVGRLLDPRIQAPQMRIQLDNGDDSVRQQIDTYEFANATVTIKIGQGTTAGNYETNFIGVVHFPGGISWDDKVANFEVDDLVSTAARVLPVNKFFPANYANIENKSKYLPIPIVYGSWLTTDGGGETVPCYQTDSTVSVGGEFTIADHAIKQIEDVYVNGVSANYSNEDLDAATFELDDAYDPDTDTVSANIRGATDDGTSTGTLLQTLPDILNDILTTWLGVAAGSIDSTAFSNWEAELTVDDYGRRCVTTEVSSNTLISDLLVEGFADLTIIAGKYYPVYRIASIASGIPTYYSFDITNRADRSKDFRVVRDEERVYTNQIVAQYQWDPINGKYASRYDVEDSAAISTVSTRRRRRLQMNWLYISNGAEARATRELHVFSTEIETAFLGLATAAVTKSPTNQFRLIYSKFEIDANVGTPFQIREIQTDYKTMAATVKAWCMLQLSPGRWAADTAKTWLLSSAWERETQGNWTDANGYADTTVPPAESSKRSIWF